MLILKEKQGQVLVLKRSGTVSVKTVHKEYVWDNIAERMLLVEFAETGCPIFRASSPLSRGQLKSKGHGKLCLHCAVDQETVETLFRIIVFANQLSLYGAIAEICEEYETLHERTGRPVVMGQSSSSAITTRQIEQILHGSGARPNTRLDTHCERAMATPEQVAAIVQATMANTTTTMTAAVEASLSRMLEDLTSRITANINGGFGPSAKIFRDIGKFGGEEGAWAEWALKFRITSKNTLWGFSRLWRWRVIQRLRSI